MTPRPISPMYRITPEAEAEAELTTSDRCWLKVDGLGLLFESPAEAEAAVDAWAHDLACIRNEVKP